MKAKYVLRYLIVMAIVAGVTGCMHDNKADTMRDLASAYLQKYDDTFIPKRFSSGGWAYAYSTVTFEAGKYPGSVVEVRIYKNEDGSYRYKDNYFKYYMSDDALAFISDELVKNEMSAIKIRFPNTIWSDEMEDRCTFGDWVSSGNCRLDVFVISQDAVAEAEQERIVKDAAKKKIFGTVTFITTSDKNNLIEYSLEDILNNQKELITAKKEFRIQ